MTMDQSQPTFLNCLSINVGTRQLTIDLADVDRIESVSEGIRLYLTDRTFVHDSSLPALLKELNPSKFIQVSPSTVVNLDRVEEFTVKSTGGFTLTLTDGTIVDAPASVRDHEAIREMVERIRLD